MSFIKTAKWTSGVVFAVVLSLAALVPALAHQEKEIGDYVVEVGFQTEPAIVGQMNALEFFASSKDGAGIEGLEETIKFEVQAGGKTKALAIQPVEGDPGHYLAPFMPTLAGDYVFHMTGKIGDQSVDETFESGPDRFSPAVAAQDVQFPVQLQNTDQLAAAVAAADARAAQAQTLGIIGIVAGVLGLAAGGLALLKRGK
jgi:hypothetical protein